MNNNYYIDLDYLFDYISVSQKCDGKENEIIDTYEFVDDVMIQTGKTLHEVRTNGNVQIDNIRYDLIKYLLSNILEFQDDNELSFEKSLVFNTLIKKGIIKEENE